MRLTIWMCVIAASLFATVPVQLMAQHTQYTLVDIGTLGGPASYFTDPGIGPGSLVLNNRGMLTGKAETDTPSAGDCPPICFDTHVFRWAEGTFTDLGTLPGGNSSEVGGINSRGWIVGGSQTGDVDPIIGLPIFHAVLWKQNEPIDLGTLRDGLHSAALHVNNSGQVVGFATINTTPDPLSFLSGPIHPFLWEGGVMQDLGTLPGDSDALPYPGCAVERNNLVTGISLGSDPQTGSPVARAFLWDNGTMIEIGTLGGTMLSEDPPSCVNNHGQVAGASTLPGDRILHPFLWEHGVMRDLGTLGGTFGLVWWLNDAGDVVGGTTTAADESFHATLWRKGVIEDLGTLEGDCFSFAGAINSAGQVVGASIPCDDSAPKAVLWMRGTTVDLNTVVANSPSLHLVEARNINSRGEIAGRGLPTGCDDLDSCGHDFLLIPCDVGGAADCESGEHQPAATQNHRNFIHNSGTLGHYGAPRSFAQAFANWRLQRVPQLNLKLRSH
jgi:probable HAF family extracellular repeat protein